MIFTVTVSRSSHPDYEFFASAKFNGRQLAMRGSQAEVDAWYDKFATAAKQAGHNVELINE